MIVYKATNRINNKVYICFSSYTLEQAVSTKKWQAFKGVGNPNYTCPFSKALRKYGEDGFRFAVIHEATTRRELYQRKEQYIREYSSMDRNFGYNCTTGGEEFIMAEDSCEKMRESQTGKVISKKVRGRIGAAVKTAWANPETIKKMKNRKHCTMTDELREKISKAVTGKKNGMYGRTGATNPNYGVPMTENRKRKIKEGREKYQAKRKANLIVKYKNMAEKECPRCKETKKLDMFSTSNSNLSGYSTYCRPCDYKRKEK